MGGHVRAYDHERDEGAVGRMLVESYRPGAVFDPWLQPRWEYMHYHPRIRGLDLTRFGLVEGSAGIDGIVHFEHEPAFGYLQRRPGADHVVEPLVEWALAHLGGHVASFGRHVVGLYAAEFDQVLRDALERRGFAEHPEHDDPNTRLADPGSLDAPEVPPGYRLQSLSDDNDLRRIDRVLWRGFDHPGESPPDGIEDRRFMQSAPNFRFDLTIVTVAPDDSYASFCGMWVVPENRVAYVEPVATDPDHRRRGAGRAAVVEALRRAGAAGADVAWVGSEQPFYLALGFQPAFRSTLWIHG